MKLARLVRVGSSQIGRWRRYLSLAILFGGGAFVPYVLASNWNRLQIQPLELHFSYFLVAFLLYPVGMLPTAAGWHTLLEAVGVHKEFRINLKIYSLSCLPRNIPGFVWFIASRSLLYQDQNVPATLIAGVSFAEIVLLASSGFATAALPVLFLGEEFTDHFGFVRFAPLLAILLLCLIVVGAPRLTRALQRFLPNRESSVMRLTASKSGVMLTLAWMLLAWSGGGMLLLVVINAVTPIGLASLPMIIGMWGVAGAVSLTLGIGIQGMGIREITLTALLSLVIPPPSALFVAVAFRVILTASEVFWALVFAGVATCSRSIGQR